MDKKAKRKGMLFVYIYIYISSLAWKFQQSWQEPVFYYETKSRKRKEKKKKTRYSTLVRSSTVRKYSISLLSSTTLVFYLPYSMSVVPRWRLT